VLVEVAIQYLLDHFMVVDPNKIKECKVSTSGGNFILRLPAVAAYHEIVKNARLDFTKALEYTGLNLCIACVEITGDYKKDIQLLNTGGREAKFMFYSENTDYFKEFDKEFVTRISNKWIEFTTWIKLNKSFSINKTDSIASNLAFKSKSVEFGGYKVTFNPDEKGISLENYLESLFPMKRNNTLKEFRDLSESDKINIRDASIIELKGGEDGLNKLGILALDVDGLGAVMESVESEEAHTELDKLLNSFFNLRLREIIQNENLTYIKLCSKRQQLPVPRFCNKIYSVTAGGDDSFFVGKWNTILDFAIKINEEFILQFPKLTLSAGLIIVDPKYPVVRFADQVENALRKAKYKYKGNKGNICLFGEVIKWDILTEIISLRQTLKKQNLTSGMLAKARLSANNVVDYSAYRLEDFWKMGYYLRDAADKDIIIKRIEGYVARAIKAGNDTLTSRNYRKILPIAARLAELDHR